MPASLLTPLQQRVLEGFFRRNQNFFLTGGAALAGFHLGHRTTQDLDLFTESDALDDGAQTLGEVAREIGATLSPTRTAPDFRRWIVRFGEEFVVVDLVRDRTRSSSPKKTFGAVRVDSAEEILANKLCTLMSRSEVRDLVDVYCLDRAGLRIEDALPLAMAKDASVTPAQLGWVLSQIEIRGEPSEKVAVDRAAPRPDTPTRAQLRAFLEGLTKKLRRLAAPA